MILKIFTTLFRNYFSHVKENLPPVQAIEPRRVPLKLKGKTVGTALVDDAFKVVTVDLDDTPQGSELYRALNAGFVHSFSIQTEDGK